MFLEQNPSVFLYFSGVFLGVPMFCIRNCEVSMVSEKLPGYYPVASKNLNKLMKCQKSQVN